MVAVASVSTLCDRLTTKLSRGQAAKRVGRRLERLVRLHPSQTHEPYFPQRHGGFSPLR